MRISLSVKAILLASVFVVSSCATTKFSTEVSQNNYSNLRPGIPYSFKLRTNQSKKMLFSNLTKDSIIGYSTNNDSVRIALSKASVTEAKDLKKSRIQTAAIAIGTVGAAAIILSSSRATRNEQK